MPRKKSHITGTDQFCGAGGSSQAVRNYANKVGGGIEVSLALNHWSLAIETHNTNFPETHHDCTDISACDPRRYPSTDFLITSPECTNHSLAKGKRRKSLNQQSLFEMTMSLPEHERSRATMWDVPRFAEYHDYNIIIVENVVDARYWVMWDAWLKAMHSLGYDHQCTYLNSMHFYPCPQSRDRMYVVFWKKNNPKPDLNFQPVAWCDKCGNDVETYQWWKNSDKKWGKYRTQYLYRCSCCNEVVEPYYYAAFNCIDWTIPGIRIGDRKKPLRPNTITRIEYGLEKYGHEQMIVTSRYTSGIGHRVKPAKDNPLPTQPGDASHYLLNPFFTYGEQSSNLKMATDGRDPLRTQNTRQTAAVVVPYIIELNRTGKARSAAYPLSTVLSGGNHHGLLQAPFLEENNGQSKARSLTDKFPCVTTMPKHGIVSHDSINAFLSYYYSGSNVASHINEAMRTVTTNDRAGLVLHQSGKPKIEDCTYRTLKPHEIQKGMAFEDDYIVLGNSKQKVKQLGNAVTPPAMEWLLERSLKTLNG